MGFGEIGLALLLTAVAFLVFRSLAHWYWKVNVAINLLTRIEGHLAAMSNRDNAEVAAEAANTF
jgi:hypothetical protein